MTTTPRPATASDELKTAVKTKYGAIAAAVGTPEATSCCGPACCGGGGTDAITRDLYDADQTATLPDTATAASLGCGNPTALAELAPGETVLDLGSGGGIDVLLSARRVGPTGRVYGLDMTESMLRLARENQRKAGATNVEFLEGEIEAIPLPDAAVDVVISNCVINLSGDKGRVLAEAFRVLRPGGRLAVSDVVRRREVSAAVRRSLELWVGCVAGALHEAEYRAKLAAAGFTDIDLEPTRIYRGDDAETFLRDAGIDTAEIGDADGVFMSAFIRATKPRS